MLTGRFFFIFLFLSLLPAVAGCEPQELEQKELPDYFSADVKIDKVESADGVFYFTLSNGYFFSMYPDKSSIFTIGVDGYLYHDGHRTDFIASDVPVLPDGMSAVMQDNDSYIQAGVEGYSGWAFFFEDGETAVLPKLAHSLSACSGVRSINHRGYNVDAPENTLSAFRLSRLKGFGYVETDVSFTADGVPVLLHDDTVDRTSDGSGKIYELTYDEVSRLSFGAWKDEAYSAERIPTLEQFLGLCYRIGLSPYLELKHGSQDQVGKIVALVEQYGLADRVTYISFFPELLSAVLNYAPHARVGYVCGHVDNTVMQVCNEMKAKGADVFVDTSDIDSSTAGQCRNNGIPMEVWTVNSQWVISTMPSYVSGVTSDFLNAGLVLAGK